MAPAPERDYSMDATITEEQARLLDACLTLDDCQIAFVIHYADRILAGEDVDMEKADAEWKVFKAEWEKIHA